MGIRNCAEVGNILSECIKRLRKQNYLLQLLYNTDMTPDKPLGGKKDNERLVGICSDEMWKKEFFDKLIKIVPRFDPKETAKSAISLEVVQGTTNSQNDEFRDIIIAVHTLVPLTQWMIVNENTNLRPFAIMGEVQKALNKKKVCDGIGQMIGGDFEVNFLTDEVSCYTQTFRVTTYD